jgi:hypothetical protein
MRVPRTEVELIQCRGGIDLASTTLKIAPGFALDLHNFEPELEGGYRRINGYERGDGRKAPSTAVYYTVVVADSSAIEVDDTLTGDTSGATSKVVIKDDDTNTLGVTNLSGNYTLSEAANGTTITATENQTGQVDPDISDTWQLAAADYYRDLIQPVSGTGDVLGAVQYGGKWYAWRQSGSVAKMYESSASGWVEVALYRRLFFDGGVLAEGDIVAGTAITGATSAATATVKAIVKNAGSYGTDASGYLVVDVTSGAFQDDEDIEVSAVTKAVADGVDEAISFTVGGQFEFIVHNFYGSSGTTYLYGADGVSPAFQFDGTLVVPIYFPAPDKDASWNTPKYIRAHRTHLFLSFPGGQLAHSGIGEPLVFSALLGAADFGLGDECTGMAPRSGEVLAVYTKSRTYGLYGYSAADWTLQVISENFGAKDRTVQAIGTVYALDAKGIAPLERVQAYGDFESSTVTRMVKPIIDTFKNVVVASVTLKERNQYRLFFNDGTALIMGDDQYLGESLPAFTKIRYPDAPTCISSTEDSSGDEVILFGDSEGYVYQAEKGWDFDGKTIEWVYRTPYFNLKTPHLLKSYRKLFVDCTADRPFTMLTTFTLSFGDDANTPNNGLSMDFTGSGGGYWDIDNWDEMYWDAEVYASRGIDLAGTGKNIQFVFYGNSAIIRPFVVQSLELHYHTRRLKRTK